MKPARHEKPKPPAPPEKPPEKPRPREQKPEETGQPPEKRRPQKGAPEEKRPGGPQEKPGGKPPEAKKPAKKPPAKAGAKETPKPLKELISELGVSGTAGLTDDEAQRRLDKYGPNEPRKEEVRPSADFLAYFWGPVPWMIEAAAFLSAVVANWTDVAIIMTLLLANAMFGFWEERQANTAIDALKGKLAAEANVRRGGQWKTIPARQVVPGDVVRLRMGNIVPADGRLLEGDPIQVDESALTGESVPVERTTAQDVYAGSFVSRGEIDALVYATGEKTYFGKTAEMIEEPGGKSRFQKAVLKIGDYLIVIALALVALIVIVAIFRNEDLLAVVRFGLVLAVAAVPVGMATVLSAAMAIGAKAIASRQVVVRRLSSVEDMAGVDVLCSDKTGTLTKNELTLGDPAAMGDTDPAEVILCAALASREEDDDPIDLAILRGLPDKSALDNYHIDHFRPFDPVSKRTEAVVSDARGHAFKVSKGAVEVIHELVGHSAQVKDFLDKAVEAFAARGFRSLGVARTGEDGRWRYLGVLPLYDPPREDSEDTIEAAKKLGVRVKMITGDHVLIAAECARRIGLGADILDASAMPDTKRHESGRLAEKIENADGFAQVLPEHKYHLVDVLQKNGHIVGMTGDGVNDAPALRKADVGIAVACASDAARGASSVVLLEPGLSGVIDAIRESRRVFRRMFSYAVYRITQTINILLLLTICIIIFNFYTATTFMIVLLVILNDGAILSIAYDRVCVSDKPERWDMRLTLGLSSVLGLVAVVESFLLLYLAAYYHLDRDLIRTLIYLQLSVGGHLTIFVARTRRGFYSYRPSWVLISAVVGSQALATVIAAYGWFMAPIGWGGAFAVWLYCLVWAYAQDWLKRGAYRVFQQGHSGYFGKRHTGD